MKINKTNAARLLDKAAVAYELVPYQVDEEDLAATHVARQLGEDVAQVFKTLVLRGDKNGIFVCVIPGDAEVDLKLAARASGNKSAAMLPMKELLPVTGYIRGGCSPVGMKKQFPTYFDEGVMSLPAVIVSGGRIGCQIEIAPDLLMALISGEAAPLVVEESAR